MKKQLFRLLMTALLTASLLVSGCTDSEAQRTASPTANFADTGKPTDTWLVYWYLCGTDLESENAAASTDLGELLQVKLPPNVKVIIETGGTKQWHLSDIPNNAVTRWLYDESGIKLLETQPDADMANPATLTDFVRFGSQFEADHRVFIFWDHGGGSAVGAILDERTQNVLSIDDMRKAFTSVHGSNPETPVFDLIGFDACLMATVDVTRAFHGIGRYLVASEEFEPALGWNYTGWVGALAQNPAISAPGLGKSICDTYMDALKSADMDDNATLSLTDLSRVPELSEAYGAFGVEALNSAQRNPQGFFTALSRSASSSENYGGNTREQGFSNMVDLADLARNARSTLPQTSDKVIAALENAVLYKVNGRYRSSSGGLSCYHSYNADPQHWQAYANLDAALMPFKCLYYFMLSGQMPPEANEYLSGSTASYTPPAPEQQQPQTIAAPAPATVHSFYDLSSLDNYPVQVDMSNGDAYVTLSQQAMDMLSSVHCNFFYFDHKDDIILHLGSDANINADWEKGIFRDNFNGQWPMLDGHPVYVEIIQEEDDYNLYAIPIKLNGKECNLIAAYSFKDEKYSILGARRGLDTQGLADKNLLKLKKGDTITTLHYAMTISGPESNPTQVEVDTFTVGNNLTIADDYVGEGQYGYFFEFVTAQNDSVTSEMVTYTIDKNNNIITSVEGGLSGNSAANSTAGANGGNTAAGGSIADQLSGGGASAPYSAPQQSAPQGGSIADSLLR